MEFKPNQFVMVQEEGYAYIGEVVSIDLHSQTVQVRRVPGNSDTVEEQPIEKLKYTVAKPRYVNYAAVAGHGSFPVDMLRYDWAAPVNFTLVKDELGRDVAKIKPGLSDELIVANVSETMRGEKWTVARWSSFLWGCRPIKTEKL